MLAGKRILLIISGGIAAYKALDLIRRLRERGAEVSTVMTKAAEQFATPLSVSALSGEQVHRDLFDLTSEAEMGHIQLSRSADLLLVCPASADLLAKMATGQANDLATTLLLATDTPIMAVPAMNVRMYLQPATQRNLATLTQDGVQFVGPVEGDMACGEYGPGRMSDVPDILAAVEGFFGPKPLTGKRVVVTSGPTHEPIDPVRYIANRSSGAQGTAIAKALTALGAEVVFVTGPAEHPVPSGVQVIKVQTAREMMEATQAAMPCDAAVFAAAVADWRVTSASDSKLKKDKGGLPTLSFAENPDILKTVSQMTEGRPSLVVGFAAETDDVLANATAKRTRKGCDWIVANDVSPHTGIMGGSENDVSIVTETGVEDWPRMGKDTVAVKLAERIAAALAAQD